MKGSFSITGTFDFGGPPTYLTKLRAVQGGNLIDLWTLNDSSLAVAKDEVNAARNGTYQNAPTLQAVAFADPAFNAPNFVAGSVQSVLLPGALLDAVMNKSEGTLLLWTKIAIADLNSATVAAFVMLQIDASNFLEINHTAAANTFNWQWRGGGVDAQRQQAGIIDTGWTALVLTWSASNNRFRAYYKGVQVGTDVIGLPALVGSFSTNTWIGRVASGFSINGNAAFCALWTKELTAAEVLTISTAP